MFWLKTLGQFIDNETIFSQLILNFAKLIFRIPIGFFDKARL